MRIKKNNIPFIVLILIFIALPLLLLGIKQTIDYRSRAASTDKLEVEDGNLAGNAKAQTDINASNNNFILLGLNSPISNNPTNTPNPTQGGAQTGLGPRIAPTTPTGSNVFSIPSTIDKSGSNDVSVAMQSFINSIPSGNTTTPNIIIFPVGSTYKLSQGIHVENKNYLTFWGYGAKIYDIGPGNQTASSAFYLRLSENIKILGFNIVGTNTKAGTPDAYTPGYEYNMGILGYRGTNDIEIADNHISYTFGDGIYFDNFDDTPTTDRWNIHHNLIELTGRQGIVPDQGQDIYIEYNIIRDSAMSVIDSEDQINADQYLRRVYIRNNLFDRWMWFGTPAYYYTCHAIPMDYDVGRLASMSDIYIENNTFQGGCMGPGNTFQNLTNDADISMWGTMPKSNIFIRNNTFNLPANQKNGWAIRLNTVNDGQVTGNTISGQTIQCLNCTNITTAPNP